MEHCVQTQDDTNLSTIVPKELLAAVAKVSE